MGQIFVDQAEMMRYTTPACVCFPIFEAPLVASPERLGWA